MAKRKRRKSKLVPILWIVTLVLFGLYFIYNNFDLKKFFSQNQEKKNPSKTLKTFSSMSKTEVSKTSSSQISYSTSNIKIKLYVGKMSDKYISLVPIEKDIPKSSTPLKDTMKALIDFRDESYLNLIPLNTKINKVWIKDNFVHIDFSDEFNYNSYGVAGYNIQVYQVVYTATQFENLKGVYFYINGKPIKYLGGEGFLINNPVKPYTSLPKFSF